MTWVRLDDAITTNPKIAALSDRAYRLYTYGLCYCGKHLTDGLIPRHMVAKLGVNDGQKNARKLVEVGLWIKVKEGYQIHDYLKHQTSKVQAEREKEVNRIKSAKARERKLTAQEAANTTVTLPVTLPEYSEPHTPTPTPTHKHKEKNIVQTSFGLFWNLYPRRDGKKKAQEAFEKALKKTDIETILEGVTRYIAFLKTTTQQIAMPATWLNGERWNDEVLAASNITPLKVPHHKLDDPTGDYCGLCHQSWPCTTESKKTENPF